MKKLFSGKTTYLPLNAPLPKNSKPLPSLATCLLMDFIGCAVTFIPFIGELIWAPISAFIFWRLFGFRKGFFGGIFSFIEEMIPGVDFIPTFTIMWAIQFVRQRRESFLVRPATR